jgi:hypothetical protein
MSPVGSISPRYVLQLLFTEYLHITQQPLKLEKNKHTFGILGILEFFAVCLTKYENYQFLLNKISLFIE